MKYEDFKKHRIQKTKGLDFRNPNQYRPYLSKDFSGRCCYCNMHEGTVTAPFHVEHFIPENTFKGIKDSLKTDYRNLMWSCPKCNLSKGDKYAGDLVHNSEIENAMFYNPEKVDYNEIFFRNELGAIDSEDDKGRQMIRELKLYRPIHTLSWLVEKLEDTYDLLERAIATEAGGSRKDAYITARDKIANIHMKKERAFRAAYNSKYGKSVQ